jgi:hypothetical protein
LHYFGSAIDLFYYQLVFSEIYSEIEFNSSSVKNVGYERSILHDGSNIFVIWQKTMGGFTRHGGV